MRQETSIKRAAFINMASRYAAALLQLAYSIALARLLTPEAFGLVAIAQVFVVFFGLFADMGLGSAIVQRQDLEGIDVSRLFGFSLILALALCSLFGLLGLPLSWVYGREELVAICALLSLSVAFSTANTVPNALLMKQQRFLLVGVRQVVAVAVASAIGIGSALLGAGHMAIVVYSVASSFFIFAWNYLPNRIRPAMRGMVGSIRKVFSYSAWLFATNFVNYFSRNLDNLLVGYFFGAAALGNYSKAYQLMRLPQTYLTGVVTPVMHPILAKRQDDIDYIYDTFVKTAKVLSLLGVFFAVFFCVCAEETVLVFFGEQWEAAVPCLRFLAVSVWAQTVCGTAGTMFQVLNKTKVQFARCVTIACFIVGGILIGVQIGSVEAVAFWVGILYYSMFVTLCPFLVRTSFGREIRPFVGLFAPDLGIAVCFSAFMLTLGLVPFPNGYVAFFAKLAAGAVAYAILVVLFRQGKWAALVLPNKIKGRIPDWMVG